MLLAFMIMKKKILILIIVVSIGVAISAVTRELIYQQQYCNQVSSWGALDTSIYCEMNTYYKKYGEYPDALEELDIMFTDGATPEMLDQIRYETSETSCQYSYHRMTGKRNVTMFVEVRFKEGECHHWHEETISKSPKDLNNGSPAQ